MKTTDKNPLIEAGIVGAREAISEAGRRIHAAEMEIKYAKSLRENARGALRAIEKNVYEDGSYCDLETREALAVHYALNYGKGEVREVARQKVLAMDAARKEVLG